VSKKKKVADGLPAQEPGGSGSDAGLALNDPADYAWRIFAFISQQADPHSPGLPDPAMSSLTMYEDDKDVIWESWALASGNEDQSEIFVQILLHRWSGVRGTAGKRCSPKDRLNRSRKACRLPLPASFVPTRISISWMVIKKVRMNRSAYETIRTNRLYSQDGLFAKATEAKAAGDAHLIQFERAAKEIKAVWIQLQDCDYPLDLKLCNQEKHRYHWRTVIRGKAVTHWGLAALHVTTKDLPGWFWADFIHIDCDRNQYPCIIAPDRVAPPQGGEPYAGTSGTNGPIIFFAARRQASTTRMEALANSSILRLRQNRRITHPASRVTPMRGCLSLHCQPPAHP